MMSELKIISSSVRDRLLNISKGDNKSFQQLIVRYCHERLLYRLSVSDFQEKFILKGGALLYAYEEFTPRPTVDLDFMGHKISNEKNNIINSFRQIIVTDAPDDGIIFHPETIEATDITVDKKYPGIRLIFLATIGTYRQKLTIDIGFGDVIIPQPIRIEYPILFGNMTQPCILAYSLETVVAEKFQSIIDKGLANSRMKDFFDIYRILKAHSFDPTELQQAINATFDNRNTKHTINHVFFEPSFAEDTVLRQRWQAFISRLKITDLTFGEVVTFISSRLKPFWDNLGNSK